MSKINFYDFVKTEKTINPHLDKHGISVPFRMLYAAPSGAGKTNGLMNLLVHMDKTFHEIILCVKSSDEPLYNLLINRLGESVRLYEDGEVPSIREFSTIDTKTQKLKRIDKYQRLIIFDDLITDAGANAKAKEYFTKSRKLGMSNLYVGQSFFQIPKMIRDNCQYFVLGRNLLRKDLRMILTCFPTDLTLEEFTDLYNEMTDEPLDTMLIDINKKIIRRNIVGEPHQL
jgi:hypothetical protein